MAKMKKKTYYYGSKEAKKVETLAKRLKVTESQIARWMSETYTTSLWVDVLKQKNEPK